MILLNLTSGPSLTASPQTSDYARAEAFIRQGKSDQGIALLEPILKQDPRNLRALNLLGIAQTEKGDLTGANKMFERALEVDAGFYPALKNLAVNEFTLKDYGAAEKHFTEVEIHAHEDPVVQTFLGRLAFMRKDYSAAIDHLTKAGPLLAQSPIVAANLVQAYLETGRDDKALEALPHVNRERLALHAEFQLGISLAAHGHYEEALRCFLPVVEKYPDSYDAGFNLALCYLETRQYVEAVRLLHHLKESGHKTAELDNLLAESYKGNGQIQEAIDSLREATVLAPQEDDNYIDLATLCIEHDAFELGLEVIEVGLHYRPESDRLMFQKGILHAMQGHFDLAEQEFQQASRLAPDKNLSYAGLTVSYMQAGNLSEAVRTLRRRVREMPNDAVLLYLLGEALIRSGVSPGESDFAEAKSALERSVSLNGTFASPYVELAKLNLRAGGIDAAVHLLEKARSLDPKDKSVYSQLAVAYRKQGKAESAAAALKELAGLNNEERASETRNRIRLVKTTAANNDLK